MKHIKSMTLLKEDPLFDYKRKVFKFLEIKHTDKAAMIDLSSFLEIKDVEKYLEKFSKAIVSPLTASKLKHGYNSKIYTAYPFRHWALARKIAEMSEKNVCGDMTSVRILWSVPKKLSSDKKTFLYSTVAGLIDLSGYIAESRLKTFHLEKVKNENNLFALLIYENDIAVELEINETLPDTMDPVRFIKTYFTNGILTNMPLAGHHNEEGALFADNKKLLHPLVEDAEWDGYDEIENTYWQMLMAIDNGTYPIGVLNSRTIMDTINTALKTEEPVNLENI